MSTLYVTGYPAEFKDGYITVKMCLAGDYLYRQVVEVKNLAEVEAAIAAGMAAVKGQDAQVSAFIRAGRKPNGFDAFMSSNRSRFTTRKEVT